MTQTQEAPPNAREQRTAQQEALASQPQNGEPNALQTFAVIAGEFIGLLKSSFSVLRLELQLALKSIPRLIVLSLSFVFFSALAWIAFSVCVAWYVTSVFNSVGAGLLSFLLVQLFVMAVLLIGMKRCKRALSLLNTRAQMHEVAEVFNEAFKENPTAKK